MSSICMIFVVLSILGLLVLFFFYPLFLLARTRFASPMKHINTIDEAPPDLTIIVVARNAETLVLEKLSNCLGQNYPAENLQVVFASDGSTDDTATIVKSIKDPRLCFIESKTHSGKNALLNKAVEASRGKILVFSDVDAILSRDAAYQVVLALHDPAIGGVCGQRVIRSDHGGMKKPQKGYIKIDSYVKQLESASSSITSNDGKIYAIHKDLFKIIPDSVTDDLYLCLSVVSQGKRFLFAPTIVAEIPTPSRSAFHEITRRRRIVTRSLRGIYISRQLFNPLRYGLYGLCLLINKVLRRLLPAMLLLLLVGTVCLSSTSKFFGYMTIFQGVLYFSAAIYPLVANVQHLHRSIKKILGLAYYFLLGNIGTLLGLIDFSTGQKVIRWEPLKSA